MPQPLKISSKGIDQFLAGRTLDDSFMKGEKSQWRG
jgi:hypothetical protein